VFIGIPETAFYPGAMYLLSRWYTKKVSLLFSGTRISDLYNLNRNNLNRNFHFGLQFFILVFSSLMHLVRRVGTGENLCGVDCYCS